MHRVLRTLILIVLPLFTLASAASAQETPAPAPAPPASPAAMGAPAVDLSVYEGTYTMTAGTRTAELRVWVEDGKLNGEIMGQTTTFRPNGEHKFLHGEKDDISIAFFMENGRATRVDMNQRGRLIPGTRNP